MDRREALKKLGAGTALAMGASSIMSVSAFAVEPAVTGSPTFTLTNTNASTVTVTASGVPAGTCQASVAQPATRGALELSAQVNTQSANTSATLSVVATKVSGNWATGDTVTVRLVQNYSCTVGGVTETCPYTWTQVFTKVGQAASGSWTPGATTGPTKGTCF